MTDIEVVTTDKSGKHKERRDIKRLRTTCRRCPGRFHDIPKNKKLNCPEVQLITFLNVPLWEPTLHRGFNCTRLEIKFISSVAGYCSSAAEPLMTCTSQDTSDEPSGSPDNFHVHCWLIGGTAGFQVCIKTFASDERRGTMK